MPAPPRQLDAGASASMQTAWRAMPIRRVLPMTHEKSQEHCVGRQTGGFGLQWRQGEREAT